MKSITKVIITIAVFTFVILYFIKGNNNTIIVEGNTECERLNEILKVRIQDYFQDKLPTEDGITLSENINKLIETKVLSSNDLKEVGTDCSGNVYVGKSGSKYYYSNDVKCGSCSTDDLYGPWSEYDYNEPDTSILDRQVLLDLHYNYSDVNPEFTEWTAWVSKDDTKTVPVLPTGVTALDTQVEEKTQYSYRNGSFKWYKNIGGAITYYNNGAYYETSPGSGYERADESQRVSKTTNKSANQSDILSQVSGKRYKLIETPQYRQSNSKYIYSRTITTSECEVANKICHYPVTKYKCYREIPGSTSYTCTRTTNIYKDCFTQDSNTALQQCYNDGGSNCNLKTCAGIVSGGSSSYVYNITYTMKGNTVASSTYNCEIRNCKLPSYYSNSSCSGSYSSNNNTLSIQNCMLNGSPTTRRCISGSGYTFTACWSSGSGCTIYMTTLLNNGYSVLNCNRVVSQTPSGGTTTPTTYGYTGSNTEVVTSSFPINGYNCTPSTTSAKKEYMDGTVATASSCPSNYPKSEPTTTTETKIVSSCGNECIGGCDDGACLKYKIVTVYIKNISGETTTNKNEAMYFTQDEYKSYINNSNYSPDSSTAIINWGNWQDGNCKNNISTSTCEQRKLYSAEIYEYKWFKSSTASKLYWENGKYSASSPGSEYKIDTSSAKWGNWTDYQDDKVDATNTRQVRTQILKRTRASYVKQGSLKLEKYLPLSEFEVKVGKTLNEMLLDENIFVQKKVVYRFRTIKEQ